MKRSRIIHEILGIYKSTYIYSNMLITLGSKDFSIADTASRTIVSAGFWAMDQFLGKTGSKWGNHLLFELFKISFTWAFQPYFPTELSSRNHTLLIPIFCHFRIWDRFLGRAEKYINDSTVNAPKISPGIIGVKFICTKYFERKICLVNTNKAKLTKSIKPKLLKTLNIELILSQLVLLFHSLRLITYGERGLVS